MVMVVVVMHEDLRVDELRWLLEVTLGTLLLLLASCEVGQVHPGRLQAVTVVIALLCVACVWHCGKGQACEWSSSCFGLLKHASNAFLAAYDAV